MFLCLWWHSHNADAYTATLKSAGSWSYVGPSPTSSRLIFSNWHDIAEHCTQMSLTSRIVSVEPSVCWNEDLVDSGFYFLPSTFQCGILNLTLKRIPKENRQSIILVLVIFLCVSSYLWFSLTILLNHKSQTDQVSVTRYHHRDMNGQVESVLVHRYCNWLFLTVNKGTTFHEPNTVFSLPCWLKSQLPLSMLQVSIKSSCD